jgi:hypothetical protein
MKNSYLLSKVFQNCILSSVKNMDCDDGDTAISEWCFYLKFDAAVIQEDFNAFIHCEKLNSYTCIVWDIQFSGKFIWSKHTSVVSSSGYGYIWAIPNSFSSI